MAYILFFLSIGLATALALVIKQQQQLKSESSIAQQKLKEAENRLQDVDRKYGGLISKEDTARQLDIQIATLEARLKQLNEQAKLEEGEISAKISGLQTKLQELKEQDIVESFGFYESKYDFQEAQEYKQRLDKIRAQQKQLIKDKQAAICRTEWSVGGSEKEGKKMTDNFLKLVLRAFNGECDASIAEAADYRKTLAQERELQRDGVATAI
ncbi:MAG: hypothetical protein WBG70_11410 [Spirulinaceae cyanobacterium]